MEYMSTSLYMITIQKQRNVQTFVIVTFVFQLEGTVTETFTTFIRNVYGTSINGELNVEDYMRDEPIDYVQRNVRPTQLYNLFKLISILLSYRIIYAY